MPSAWIPPVSIPPASSSLSEASPLVTGPSSVQPETPAFTPEQTIRERNRTPAARIDELFNELAAGPSDAPEAVASLRRQVLAQVSGREDGAVAESGTSATLILVWFIGGMLPIALVGIVGTRIFWRIAPTRDAGRDSQRTGVRRNARRVHYSLSSGRRNAPPSQKLRAR